jgi:hypothetical protein
MFFGHIPVNHHLRPLFRALNVLAGLYLLLFGVLGLISAGGLDLFARGDLPRVLGQSVNSAHAVLALAFGALTLVGTAVGRNVDHFIIHSAGLMLLVIGLWHLAALQTDANVLGFTMTNCVVTFVLGLVLMTAGLYVKIRPIEEQTHLDRPVLQTTTAH